MTRNPNKAPATLSGDQLQQLTDERAAIENGDPVIRDELYRMEIENVYDRAHALNTMGSYIDRIEQVMRAQGVPEDDHGWADPEANSEVDGGSALVELAQRMHSDETYELSPQEKILLEHEGRVVESLEARAAIDRTKLKEDYPGESIDDALLAKVIADRKLHKTKREQFINGELPDTYTGNPEMLGGVIKQEGRTKRFLRDTSAYKDYGTQLLAAIDAQKANPNDPEAAAALEKALENVNEVKDGHEAAAATFTRIAQEYPNEDYQSPAILAQQNQNTAPAEDTEAENGQVVPTGAAPARRGAPRSGRGNRRQGDRTPGTRGPRTSAPAGQPRRQRRADTGSQNPADPANTNSGETNDEDGTVHPAAAAIRREAHARRARAGGNGGGGQPPEGPPQDPNGNGGNSENNNSGNNPSAQERLKRLDEMVTEGQRMRVRNAASLLANSGRRRSRFEGFEEGTEHEDFRNEVYKLMEREHPEFFDIERATLNKDELKALTANMNAYVTAQYNLVTGETVDGMAGETDPKQRAKNNRRIRLGAAAVGFFIGGPAGAALAGATALAVTKALDYEVKGRAQLRTAVKEEVTELSTDEYIDDLDHPREFTIEQAFQAATGNLREQYERGVVKGRQKRIGGAALVGGSWFLLSYGGMHQAMEAFSYTFGVGGNGNPGGELRHWLSTLDNPGGNPGYNYTPGDKPFSLGFMQWIYNNPGVAAAAGAAAVGAGAVIRRRASGAVGAGPNTSGSNNSGPNNQNGGGNASPPRPRPSGPDTPPSGTGPNRPRPGGQSGGGYGGGPRQTPRRDRRTLQPV